MHVLVIDVGGTNIKMAMNGPEENRKVPSGPELTPQLLVEHVTSTVHDWTFDAISVGFPAPVVRGQIQAEPANLGPGWVGFNFEAVFGKPVKVINDAAMQALGSYEGGRMLFLGLGTGLGSALIIDDVVAPLELAHLPYRKKRTYEDYLGERALRRLGRKKWQRFAEDVVARFKTAFVVDYVVLGGGNAKKLVRLPPYARAGNNRNAFVGGFRLWEVNEQTQQHRFGNA
jgi:predicted NBD/HSP70 family sugar kinase